VGYDKSHAFRWTQAGGIVDIGTLPGRSDAAATAVSDNGKIVVGISAPRPLDILNSTGWDYDTSDTRAFRWTQATGMQDLTQLLAAQGITLVAALGISPDGQFIVGAATTLHTAPTATVGFLAQFCDGAEDRCLAQSPPPRPPPPPPTCTLASELGDFDGDGKDDILFRRPDGFLFLYFMNGFQVTSAQLVGATGV